MKHSLKLLFMFCPLFSMCQPPAKTITGWVLNENNEPISTTIISQSSIQSTITNNDGAFSLSFPTPFPLLTP